MKTLNSVLMIAMSIVPIIAVPAAMADQIKVTSVERVMAPDTVSTVSHSVSREKNRKISMIEMPLTGSIVTVRDKTIPSPLNYDHVTEQPFLTGY